MRPLVNVTLPSGERAAIGAGAVIGRLPTAGLRMEDPRISEAHALVSLRGRRLVLLSLCGELRVGRQRVERVTLQAGQQIRLAEGVALQIDDVVLPPSALALTGLGIRPVELESEVATIHRSPWRLEPGFDPEGAAYVTADGEGWTAHVDGEATPLSPGTELVIEGHTVHAIAIRGSDTSQTQRSLVAHEPLTLVARYTSVHLHREGCAPVTLAGMSAKILTELARFDSPVPWEWVAREIWGPLERFVLRTRWDRNLRTLRAKLKAANIRSDFVFSDGRGNIELVLGPHDEVRDES